MMASLRSRLALSRFLMASGTITISFAAPQMAVNAPAMPPRATSDVFMRSVSMLVVPFQVGQDRFCRLLHSIDFFRPFGKGGRFKAERIGRICQRQQCFLGKQGSSSSRFPLHLRCPLPCRFLRRGKKICGCIADQLPKSNPRPPGIRFAQNFHRRATRTAPIFQPRFRRVAHVQRIIFCCDDRLVKRHGIPFLFGIGDFLIGKQ